MYDMYPWDKNAKPGKSRRRRAKRTPSANRAARAVQFALDRRDNGGDGATDDAATTAER
jgi:hypothetical protein